MSLTERDKAIAFATRALRMGVYESFADVTMAYFQMDGKLKPSDIYAILDVSWGYEMAGKYVDWFESNYGQEAWQ